MTDEEKLSAPHVHSDPWQQVATMVGANFLARMTPDSRADLQMLIEHASAFGRNTHGPVREVQTLVGDRWSALLLMLLRYGPIRFSILQRITGVIDNVGISRRMLSFTLRTLERNGLVLRNVLATVPPNVEYSLTPLGAALSKRVMDFLEWLTTQIDQIELARAEFEKKHDAKTPDASASESHAAHDE